MNENQKYFPFAVSLELHPPLHLKTAAVELTLVEGEALEEYADMVECLCDLSGLGAFAETELTLKESRANLNKSKASNSRTWTATINFAHVHAGFYRLFLQMLAQCHHFLEAVAGLKVVELGQPFEQRTGLAVENVANLAYGKRIERLPFVLVETESSVTEINAARLKFPRPISEKEYETIRKALEDWASLVYTGGFASPFRSLDTHQLLRVEVAKIHHSLVECAVSGWNADAAAIDFLINLCCGLHANVLSMEELEIE